jgi:hypothetical protein
MKSLAIAASLALMAAQPAAAVTYDAFSSFNATQGAGGFTYGVYNDSTNAFSAFTQSAGCSGYISNTICLNDGALPAAFKSTSGAHQSGSVIVPGDALILHPGPDAGEDSAVLFTAPTAGIYNISISTFVADNNPSGVNIYIFSPTFGSQPITTLDSTHTSYSLNTAGPLFAGEQIGIAVNYDGVYYDDSTGVNFTLSSVPEPATWTMMLTGFGIAGAALRRRKPVAAI